MPDASTLTPVRPGAPARCFALIPAAGSGSRAGLNQPKQYQQIAGARLIDHTLAAFFEVGDIAGVALVVAPDDAAYPPGTDPRVSVFRVGGSTRAHSVFNGLRAWLEAGAAAHDWVLVHDAARCLITPSDIERLMAACRGDAVGGLLAVPLADTLKVADEGQRVVATVDRAGKWLAQTPQMFRIGELLDALRPHLPQGFAGITDEASAMEASSRAPLLVRGSVHNFKVTFPEDFALAEALLLHRARTPHKDRP